MNWQPLTSQTDLDALQSLFGRFHDGCLRESYLWTGYSVSPNLSMSVSIALDLRVRLLFQRQFANPSAIELLFEQVTTFHLRPQPGSDNIIMDATLLHHEGLFYWANEYCWSPENSDLDEVTWIAGKALSWRDASDWMGSELRLGPGIETPSRAEAGPPSPDPGAS